MKKSNKSIISEIRYLFFKGGSEEYFGEKVSQFEHAAQAMLLAISHEDNIDMQVAAFLHDIGHLLESDEHENTMDKLGRIDHEDVAATWLNERGFSEKIQKVIKNHVAAKRYLCFKHADYYERLSDASKKTLEYQGGIMSENEAFEFEEELYFHESIRLRKWDDEAKKTNQAVPSLDDCLEIVSLYLSKQRQNQF